MIVQTSGQPEQFSSCAELTGKQGFVVAPFAPSETEPILLIRPDTIERGTDVASLRQLPAGALLSRMKEAPHQDYHIDFANFHAHLLSDEFQKLVLSRSVDIEEEEDRCNFLKLFHLACVSYPRMMVCLVFTLQSGMWLTATPEILLSGHGSQWQTIALAGTMPYDDDLRWNDKNIQEQRYVATYITQQLEQFTSDITEEGPRTARAGHLAHLRSDFHFSLPEDAPIGKLLQALHPTPAVCGLPKEKARQFILQNEHHQRSYYSGFMGPLDIQRETNLFVTLRCMRIFLDGYRLYAGGGLLKESIEEQEWQETEAKLDTMRHIIYKDVRQ
jgi:isochorismate synthase